MRVVHLSYSNAAGVPQAWARAHREAGVDALHVAEIPNEFGYSCDTVVRWSRNDQDDSLIEPFIADATHIVVHDHPGYIRAAGRSGKPWLYRAFGTPSYRARAQLALLDVPRVTDHPEFTRYGFELIRTPVWADEYPRHQPADLFTACHAPSNRAAKGTEHVIRACQAAGVPLELIEDTPHAECLLRKARGHVLIDQLDADRLAAYGVNGLEAWAIGMPVIGRGGTPPVIDATPETLPDLLGALRRYPDLCAWWGDMGRQLLREEHDPVTVAAQDLARLGAVPCS